MRVKRGVVRHAKHKKIIKSAKGYVGRRNSVFKLAKQAILKSLSYQYRDRRNGKRDFRALWITRINAALSSTELSYSQFINKLKVAGIALDRKILSELATNQPAAFTAVVDAAAKAK